jgi:hypothetical protein
MAGDLFNPGVDPYTFIPFYLRAFKDVNYKKLTPEERVKNLPTIDADADTKLAKWVLNLNNDAIENALYRYGVDALPVLNRLAKLQRKYAEGGKMCDIINYLWSYPV